MSFHNILEEFLNAPKKEFSFTHSGISENWLKGAPDSLKSNFKSCKCTGELVGMVWECFGDLEELEIATARKVCETLTRTEPGSWDSVADRRIALFVPAAYKAMGEEDFGKALEDGDLPSSPDVNVAGPDGTDDEAKKEERRTFSLRPISASPAPRSAAGGGVSAVSQLFDKCLKEEEEEEEAKKEGTLLVPLPTQSSGVPNLVKRDSAKWAALDASGRAELVALIRTELVPGKAGDARDAALMLTDIVAILLRGGTVDQVLEKCLVGILFFNLREEKGIRAAKKFQSTVEVEESTGTKLKSALLAADKAGTKYGNGNGNGNGNGYQGRSRAPKRKAETQGNRTNAEGTSHFRRFNTGSRRF